MPVSPRITSRFLKLRVASEFVRPLSSEFESQDKPFSRFSKTRSVSWPFPSLFNITLLLGGQHDHTPVVAPILMRCALEKENGVPKGTPDGLAEAFVRLKISRLRSEDVPLKIRMSG